VIQLRKADIEVASIKGPTTQARWYDRPGERPSSDVDLWLSPHQIDRAGDALRLLQPDHPWCAFFGDLASKGRVQTVTLSVDDIQVDLHIDLMKTGLPTVQSEEFWASTEWFRLPDGTSVRVLDSTSALLLFLVHLNKDRFQRLLGYADVVRIIRRGVDWPRFTAMVEGEGLTVPALSTLATALDDLGVDRPTDVPGPPEALLGTRLWRVLWARSIRLRGSEGRKRFRRRQLVIIPLSNRSGRQTWRAIAQQALPPKPVRHARTQRRAR
jgi:hypothetical protein